MLSSIIGVLGMIVLASAWIPQTIHTIKTWEHVNPTFNLLYVIGGLLLVIYSIMIGSVIFVAVNLLVVMLSSVNLFYTYKVR